MSDAIGKILTIDAKTGKLIANITMSTAAIPSFTALDAAKKVLFSMVPYTYTHYGVFSFDINTGSVKQLYDYTKDQLDGIAVSQLARYAYESTKIPGGTP